MTQEFEIDRRRLLISGALLGAGATLPQSLLAAAPAPRDDTLWYRRPADEWVQALAIGNGRLGAMVFGGIASERIQLNEDTFFSGGPYDPVNPDARAALPRVRELVFAGQYVEAEKLINASVMARPLRQMSYQTVGDLLLTFPGLENASNYLRDLHLPTATARTQFDIGSARMVRTVFASAVDQVLVVHLGSEVPGKRVSVNMTFATPQRADVVVENGDTLVMRGSGPTDNGVNGAMKFEARARVLAKGDRLGSSAGGLYIQNADEVLMLIAMATNYRRFDDLSADPAALNLKR